jgi:hypothetical protein
MTLKLRKVFIAIVAMMMMTTALFADAEKASLTARSFQFKFKSADRAAALIKPLISAEGSLSIQPSSNTLVVTDRPENIRNIVAALAKFDTAAQQFRLELKLVAASRVADGDARVPEDLKQISARLSGVLKFNSFEKLGDLTAETREGDPVLIEQLAPGYRAEFKTGEFDSLSDTLRINEFRLQRFKGDASAELVQVMKTSLNLKVGQTVVLGASRDPQSNKALMLVLVARRG